MGLLAEDLMLDALVLDPIPNASIAMTESLAIPAGPIILATDSESSADASLPLAQVLASRVRTEVEIVDALAKTQEDDPVQVLTDRAAALDARVILIGHQMQERRKRSPGIIVSRLLHDGDCPVLVVDPEMTWLPRRVVICTDFSDYSAYAARVALTMVARDAKVLLVNVGPGFDETDPAEHERAQTYRRQAEMRMARIRDSLPHAHVQFVEVFLNGVAVDEILRVADDFQADLIVSSTHGRGFIRRMLVGSVAQGLLRGAWCSVLCVPGSARSNAAKRANKQAIRPAPAAPVLSFD